MSLSTTEAGRKAEAVAALFLELQGYEIRERNARFSRLEIDLVAARASILALVEVKYRRSAAFGGAAGAVSPVKRRMLEAAAAGYLRTREIQGHKIRFDVVLVEGQGETQLIVRHISNAFQAQGRYRS